MWRNVELVFQHAMRTQCDDCPNSIGIKRRPSCRSQSGRTIRADKCSPASHAPIAGPQPAEIAHVGATFPKQNPVIRQPVSPIQIGTTSPLWSSSDWRSSLLGVSPGDHRYLFDLEFVCDYVDNTGIAPSCCMSPSVAPSVQCSVILPSMTVNISMMLTATFLPVGGMPKNGPRCVACKVLRVITWSPSA